MTAAAASTCDAVPSTLAEAFAQERPHAARWRVSANPGAGDDRLDHVQGESLGLGGECSRVPGRQTSRRTSIDKCPDDDVVQSLQPHRHRVREPRDGGRERGGSSLQVLWSPGEQQEHRAPVEPSGQVQQRLPRCVVRPMQILDGDNPRHRTVDQGRENRGDRVEQARACGRRLGRTGAATPRGSIAGRRRASSARVAAARRSRRAAASGRPARHAATPRWAHTRSLARLGRRSRRGPRPSRHARWRRPPPPAGSCRCRPLR